MWMQFHNYKRRRDSGLFDLDRPCPGQDSFLSFPMLSFDPTLIFSNSVFVAMHASGRSPAVPEAFLCWCSFCSCGSFSKIQNRPPRHRKTQTKQVPPPFCCCFPYLMKCFSCYRSLTTKPPTSVVNCCLLPSKIPKQAHISQDKLFLLKTVPLGIIRKK